MKNKDKERKAEEQMASNCCYRLESQKKSCLAGFRGYGFLLQKKRLYLLIHIHRYVNLHLTASWMRANLLSPLMKRLHGSTSSAAAVAAFPDMTQLLFMISITSSGKQGTLRSAFEAF